MNYLFFLGLALSVMVVVCSYRKQQDRKILAGEVAKRGGELIRSERVRKGSPFPDTTRGWWAWRVVWRDGSGERASWALTTREGLGEWRD